MPVETSTSSAAETSKKMPSDIATCLGVGDKTVPSRDPLPQTCFLVLFYFYGRGSMSPVGSVWGGLPPPAFFTFQQMLCTVPPSSSNQEPPLQIFLSDKQVEMGFQSHTVSTPELWIGMLCVD